jgi:superfamily II DNA/RNA helicase
MYKAKSQSSGGFKGNGKPFRPFRNKFQGKNPSSQRARFSGSNLNISQLISKAKSESAAPVAEHVIKHQFRDFALDPRVIQNIEKKGYKIPTPIQDQTIPTLLQGRDVIGLANTGTGKTAAFLLPLINKLLADRNQKVLILAPTRELAVQIHDELREFAQGLNLWGLLCIGGMDIRQQARRIKTPFNFLIGTPGRIIDLNERKLLHLDRFQNVVLDEADRMVDMGFIHDIRHIFSRLPKQRQNICFSATMKKDVEALIHDFLTNPVTVSVVQRQTAANVEQEVIRVASAGQKMEVLVGLLKKPEFKRVLVFGRTKHGVEKISKTLHSVGFPVDSIHGDKSQSYRLRALRSFKEGKVKILVATDVAARGLDIDNVSHVINYDLPANYEDYVHRIGRTGRAAQKGNAISLVT